MLNPCFQAGIDVMGRPCLVIGGGAEAADKAERLLAAGARLAVVSPRLNEDLREWKAAGRFEHRERRFETADLDGVFLVINTVPGEPELAREVYELACRQRCLINTWDRPSQSNIAMAALVSAGHLRVSISTSNASPSLARRLREDLERIFDDGEFVDYLDELGRLRARLRETLPDSRRRSEILRSLAADFRLDANLGIPPDWRQRIAALMDGSPGDEAGEKQ